MPDEDARLTDFAPAEDADQDPPEDDPPGEAPPDDGGSSGDGDPSDGGPPDDGGPSGDGGPTNGDPPDDDPEPAVPTSTWRPDGTCDACGDPAERRWRDGEAFVCTDCKEW